MNTCLKLPAAAVRLTESFQARVGSADRFSACTNALQIGTTFIEQERNGHKLIDKNEANSNNRETYTYADVLKQIRESDSFKTQATMETKSVSLADSHIRELNQIKEYYLQNTEGENMLSDGDIYLLVIMAAQYFKDNYEGEPSTIEFSTHNFDKGVQAQELWLR